MSIENVRAAEKKIQAVMEELLHASAEQATRLGEELRKATDAYAKAVRELKASDHLR